MTLQQKYEFFAPVWRVMRDDAMPVEEVRRQVEYVALAVKQGSQVSWEAVARKEAVANVKPRVL